MDAERLRRAMSIFERACGLAGTPRLEFLDAECADDLELRREVDAMLGVDAAAGGPISVGRGMQAFLSAELPAVGELHGGPNGGAGPGGRPLAGQYVIIRVIGQGGMGTVYEAEQARPRRRVALKAIRPGLITQQVLRRFEYEAQILGRLQHPGIAQIYEAGTDDSAGGVRAYFAMEFVQGQPLDEYCRAHDLSIESRLDLVAKICDAVQYAHQRGVIHRDLKPANILVDGHGQPKILDFGVARTTDADAELTLLQTRVGQLVGTLPYMSPEQVAGESAAVDTRTDVYALGVILYLLLAGELPIDVRECGIPEAARRIAERTPSRLGTLNRTFRGEVEIIVAKALEKDRERRYQAARDLGDDIRRFLAGEAIAARRDSTFYVLRKTLARYRSLVWAAGAFIIVLLAFGIVTALQGEQNRRLAIEEGIARDEAVSAARTAQQMRARADEAATDLRRKLTENNVERGRLLGLTGNLLAAENMIWPEYLRDPNSRQAYWSLWELYSRQPLLRTVYAHDEAVQYVSVANADLAATAGRDRMIKLWDLRSGACARVLEGHTDRVTCVQFAQGGSRLISTSFDGTLRIWDVERGACVASVDTGVALWVAAVSADDRLIATGDATGQLSLWDATSLDCVGRIDAPSRPVRAIAFNPDPDAETNLVFGCDSGDVLFVHVAERPDGTCEVRRVNALRAHQGPIGSLVISPDGATLVSGGVDRWMRFWDLATGGQLHALNPGNGTIRTMQFSSDGATLAVGGWWTIDLFDGQSWEKRTSLATHHGVFAIGLTPDGRIIAPDAEMPRNDLRIWELARNAASETKSFHPQGVWCVDVAPDGRRAITTGSAAATEWDLDSRSVARTLPRTSAWAAVARYSPDGRYVATLTRNFGVRLWDAASLELVRDFPGPLANGQPLAFSPDGATLLLGRPDGAFVLYGVPDGAERATVAPGSTEPLWARFTPDGRRAVTVSRDARVRIWDVATASELHALPMSQDAQPWCVDVSPDGRRLAVGTWGRVVELFDLDTYASIASLSGHNQLVSSVAFDPRPGSDLLASSSNDGTIRIWDVRTPRNLLTLSNDVPDIFQVAWRPGRDELIAVGVHGSVMFWNLDYYRRHIAGNVEFQVQQRRELYPSDAAFEEARNWARQMRIEHWGAPADATTNGDE